MPPRIPAIAYVLGLAGAIPFIICGVAASSAGAQAVIGLLALLGYGAVILSFVGAVHWGFALSHTAPDLDGSSLRRPSMTIRLAAATVPALIGWAALLLALLSLPQLGLAVLIVGFLATVATEARWNKIDLLPPGYMALRWLLSGIVVTTLLVVLALRLIGATIVF
eukprot:gene10826-10905_t